MVKPKLSYTLCLWPFIASSIMAPSQASDRTQCHDIPEKQAVLEEGKELLRTAPDGRGFLDHRHNWPFSVETRSGAYRYYEGAFDVFDESEPKADENIEGLEGLRKAAKAAEALDRHFKVDVANNLYTRILTSLKFANLSDEEQADIMEGVVRTKIKLGLKREDEDFRSFRFRMLQNDHELFGAPSYVSGSRYHRFILRNLNRTSLSSQDFALVKSLCLKASAIRAKEESNDNLATDLIVIGVLCARNNEPREAREYLLRAKKLRSKNYKPALTPKMERHQSATIAKEFDYSDRALARLAKWSKVVANDNAETNELVISTLIDSYVTSKEPEEAIALFKQNCLGQKDSNLCIIAPESLCLVLTVLPANELNAFVLYFIQAFQVDSQNAMFDASFSKIMQVLNERGWKTESDFICDSLSSPSRTSTLFAVARWYADSNRVARLLVTVKLILVAIQHDSDEQSLTSLQLIQKLIANVLKDEPGLAEVRRETERLTAYHEDQIRRKQCLTMAKELNETAFALERKAQPEMASKLYKHALEIKQANLASNDPETAAQLVDLARAEAAQQHFSEAENYFERALSMMRKNSKTDPSDTVSALESYGMMLNDWKHEAKATKVYEEAKSLHSQIKASPWRHIGAGK